MDDCSSTDIEKNHSNNNACHRLLVISCFLFCRIKASLMTQLGRNFIGSSWINTLNKTFCNNYSHWLLAFYYARSAHAHAHAHSRRAKVLAYVLRRLRSFAPFPILYAPLIVYKSLKMSITCSVCCNKVHSVREVGVPSNSCSVVV